MDLRPEPELDWTPRVADRHFSSSVSFFFFVFIIVIVGCGRSRDGDRWRPELNHLFGLWLWWLDLGFRFREGSEKGRASGEFGGRGCRRVVVVMDCEIETAKKEKIWVEEEKRKERRHRCWKTMSFWREQLRLVPAVVAHLLLRLKKRSSLTENP
ncbi:hypothetical protein Ahy_B01g055028 isoform A [Arachis hypogaea]|uniref:Uncharacterized protein n=1 Tax=Arachis hypogaea TaxID=3818 RepID=A0A445AUV1_ARAHY|nr:hypothetical protein Ahy_B01g055028 isoform A [Arachis hypogaea]